MPLRTIMVFLLPLAWIFAACHSDAVVGAIAIRSAEVKTPERSDSKLAAHANETFREALLDARFDDLPEARRLLTAAYLENPRDPEIALLLAHSHLWALSERSRNKAAPDPRVTDHAILSDRYFAEAALLAPEDTRIDGWQGAVRLTIGSIHQDQRTTREGYFQLQRAKRQYPSFNQFSAAYPLSAQPRDSERFAEAVESMWANLEACGGDDFDRSSFDYAAMMVNETTQGRLRVCWNTKLVPHNFEGFFMVMGDVLTKSGDVENARRAYNSARLTPDFANWRYAPILEARLANIDARAHAFEMAKGPEEEPPTMFSSEYACTGCHAR
jgi:hypothetical protein